MSNISLISKIKNGWKTILFFLLVASLFAVKFNYFSAKRFETSAQIKTNATIYEKNTPILSDPLSAFGVNTTKPDVQTVNAIVNATKKNNYNVEYFQVEPLFRTELYNYSPIKVSYSLKTNNFYKQAFTFSYLDENNFLLQYDFGGIKRERKGVFGKEIHEAELNFTVNKNTALLPQRAEELIRKNLQFIIYSDNALAENLAKNSVKISVQNGSATVVVTNTAPAKAMDLANSIAETLLENTSSSANLEIIDQQLSKITDEMEMAQERVAKYKMENNITSIPLQTDAQLKHLEMLEEQKLNLDLHSLALDNLSDYLRKNRINGNAAPEYGTISDPVFATYITKLNEKIEEQTNKGGNAAVETEINFLKNTIAEGIRNTRKKVALQKDEINKQIANTKETFSIVPEKESNLQTLNRNLYLIEKLYNYLVDKRTEAMYSSVMPIDRSDLIQKATLPNEPINTKASTIWLMAMLMGLITGLIAVVAKGKNKKQIITSRKNIDKQQSIPYFAGIVDGNKIDISKQFDKICTKLLVLRERNEKQIIAITSAGANEGKSFIAVQLAKSLAALDLKVLVVDMNLEKQEIENLFDVKANFSLADVFEKQIELQEAVQITSIPYLDILIAGEMTQGINNLLASNKLLKTMNELKKHYDFIIVDTSNTNNAIDAIPIMKLSNLNLYVIKSGSGVDDVFENVEKIKNDFNISNIHFLLNMTSIKYNPGSSNSNSKSFPRRNKPSSNDQTPAESMPFLKRAALWFY